MIRNSARVRVTEIIWSTPSSTLFGKTHIIVITKMKMYKYKWFVIFIYLYLGLFCFVLRQRFLCVALAVVELAL